MDPAEREKGREETPALLSMHDSCPYFGNSAGAAACCQPSAIERLSEGDRILSFRLSKFKRDDGMVQMRM